jgi:hypothetical protein
MSLTVKITPNDNGNPPGKLADAELHFTDGALEGLKLIGLSAGQIERLNNLTPTVGARHDEGMKYVRSSGPL